MNTNNVAKLKTICEVFGISVTAVANVADVSRTYASLVIHGKMTASSEFWRNIETRLEKLISLRQIQLFDVPSVATTKLESLLPPK